jgi:hypothetical protein
LITHTAKPTDNLNSYKQKYSYITGTDILPYDRVPVKEAKPAPKQDKNKIGEYEVNTSTPQTFPINSGDILFTATLSDEGEVSVDVKSNQTISDLSTDPVKVKTIDNSLKANLSPEEIVEFDKKSNEEKAKLFFVAAITQSLNKTLAEQKATPAVEEEVAVQPMAPPEVVAQQDIEAKKADIEKRSTKVISSEIVEKGNRKGQTRTVTQTNSIEEIEGTIVSVTEYEAKVGDTTVTLGGKTMTVKEFKERFDKWRSERKK